MNNLLFSLNSIQKNILNIKTTMSILFILFITNFFYSDSECILPLKDLKRVKEYNLTAIRAPIECVNSDAGKDSISPLEVCQQTCQSNITMCNPSKSSLKRFTCTCPESNCPYGEIEFQQHVKKYDIFGHCYSGYKALKFCSDVEALYCLLYTKYQPISIAYCLYCKLDANIYYN